MSSLFLFIFLLISFSPLSSAVEQIIHWNTTNLLWADEEPTITVRLGDRLRIICPDETADEDEKYLIVYQGSEMSTMSCMLESAKRQVVLCGEGMAGRSTLVPVVRKSALPGALEFQPDHSYYWLSTSMGSADTINTSTGGLCKSDNMRLKIVVREKESVPQVYARDLEQHGTGPVMPHHPKMIRYRTASADSGHKNVVPDNVVNKHLEKFDIGQGQFAEVLQMASNGITGTFPRERHVEEEVRVEVKDSSNPWDPVSIYQDFINGAEKLLHDEPFAYTIGEEGARSYPLESSAWSTGMSLVSLLTAILVVLA